MFEWFTRAKCFNSFRKNEKKKSLTFHVIFIHYKSPTICSRDIGTWLIRVFRIWGSPAYPTAYGSVHSLFVYDWHDIRVIDTIYVWLTRSENAHCIYTLCVSYSKYCFRAIAHICAVQTCYVLLKNGTLTRLSRVPW